MGQQLKKVAKRRRRLSYLTRKKALAKAGVSRKARAAARSEAKASTKKPAAKKAAKKPAAKKAAAAVEVAETLETVVAPFEAVEAAPAAEAPVETAAAE